MNEHREVLVRVDTEAERPFLELAARLTAAHPEGAELTTERRCGSCSACCHANAVEDVTTAGTWCQHCTKPGCAIYATRPGGCVGYACLWLLGEGTDFDRPDRSGWIGDLFAPPAEDPNGVPELRAFRWRTHRGKAEPPAWLSELAGAALAYSRRALFGVRLENPPGHARTLTYSPDAKERYKRAGLGEAVELGE